MKNLRFNLQLFSEEGAPSSENSAADLTTDNSSVQSPAAPPSEEAPTDAEKLSEALGLEAPVTVEELVAMFDSHKSRQKFNSELREILAADEYRKLDSEAKRFASAINGFDLVHELSDMRFRSMIHSGFSVEEAFRAVHFEEILSAAVENAKTEAMSEALENLRRISARPDENGMAGSAPARTQTSVQSLSGKSIRDILRRVEKGAKVKF